MSDETHRWLPWVIALAFTLGFLAYSITLIAKDPDSMHECDQMCTGYGRKGAKFFRGPTATEPMHCECWSKD